MKPLAQAIFISHGGGPLPLLGDAAHAEMVSCLQGIAAGMPRPDAILMVSAHWEEEVAAITAQANPSLIYDYYGFPPASYDIQYPCAGLPSLAREVHQLLEQHGIAARLDEERGLDHGVFVPLKIMYPEADIPCVQLSLLNTLGPAQHIAIGRALSGLGRQNVLVIGSGFSFHNMRAFFAPANEESTRLNHAFEDWLVQVCSSDAYTEEARSRLLINWAEAPGARFCHPREEHLLPLHVCYGLAQAPCREVFRINIMNKASSLYVW